MENNTVKQKLIRALIAWGAYGRFGKEFIVRRTKWGTVIAKYPRKTDRPPSAAQVRGRQKFKEAVAYAKQVMANPEKYGRYLARLKEGESLYQKAVTAFMKGERLKPRRWWELGE